MSIAISPCENRVLLSGVAWSTYEALLADTQCRGTKFTYDRGYLEIMSPSREHEHIKSLLGRMIETMTEELDIPISTGGSTTLKAELKRRGAEPDECYYVANEPRMRGREDYDPAVDPPPDVLIEVNVSRNSLDKFAIYADFGVPEIWTYEDDALCVYQLQGNNTYARRDHSPAFPFLPWRASRDFSIAATRRTRQRGSVRFANGCGRFRAQGACPDIRVEDGYWLQGRSSCMRSSMPNEVGILIPHALNSDAGAGRFQARRCKFQAPAGKFSRIRPFPATYRGQSMRRVTWPQWFWRVVEQEPCGADAGNINYQARSRVSLPKVFSVPQPCPLIHVAPAEQPTSVAEIAEILFPAYTVDDGRVSLAGCALEDRLVLQLVYEHGGQRLEIYLNAEGKEVDGQPDRPGSGDEVRSAGRSARPPGGRFGAAAGGGQPPCRRAIARRGQRGSGQLPGNLVQVRRGQVAVHDRRGLGGFAVFRLDANARRRRRLSVLTRGRQPSILPPPTTGGSPRPSGSRPAPRPAAGC